MFAAETSTGEKDSERESITETRTAEYARRRTRPISNGKHSYTKSDVCLVQIPGVALASHSDARGAADVRHRLRPENYVIRCRRKAGFTWFRSAGEARRTSVLALRTTPTTLLG